MSKSPSLKCHGRPVRGAFGLLSRNENGLTFAMGYALSRHPRFMQLLLRRMGIERGEAKEILLQRRTDSEDYDGITDIEVEGDDFYLIVEAKKFGWPTEPQLQMYADRLILKPQSKLVLCALGVPPVCDSPARSYLSGNRIEVRHLRWHEVLEVARHAGPEDKVLSEFAKLIEEVIAMQSYDSEVSVRDIGFDDPTRDLYYDDFMYNAGPRGNSEPLFFAPNFTKVAPVGLDGIQFISRVYYRDRFVVTKQTDALAALARAAQTIDDRVKKLEKRKTTAESIKYLASLHENWARGIKRMHRIWPADEHEVMIYFLGKPMRLPVPLTKDGGMVVPGFNLTLEELLNVDNKTFKC